MSRIVVVHGYSFILPEWATDVLGLGLNIEPAFFYHYYSKMVETMRSELLLGYILPEESKSLTYTWDNESKYLCVN